MIAARFQMQLDKFAVHRARVDASKAVEYVAGFVVAIQLQPHGVATKLFLNRFQSSVEHLFAFVNHENEVIKTNRKNTIGNVYQAFKTIADIKEITI